MAIAFVQQVAGSAISPATFTLPSTPISGNLLVAVFNALDGGGGTTPVGSISGGGVTTWTKATNGAYANYPGAGSGRMEIWYGIVNTTPSTAVVITVAGTASACAPNTNVSEWSGVQAVTDGTNVATGTSTSGVTGSVTTTNAKDLLIGGVGWNDSASSTNAVSAIQNSFTALSAGGAGGSMPMDPMYRIFSATAAYSSGWTLPASVMWSGILATFKEALPGRSQAVVIV